MGRPSRRRSGARRGRNGSSSSPRARAWIRAPSSPNRATSADRASSATGADPAQAEAGQPGAHVGIGGQQPGRVRGEEGRLATRRDEVRGSGPGQDGGHRRAEAGAGDARPDVGLAARRHRPVAGQRPPERPGQPLDEDRLGTPQRLEAVDLDLEQPERRIERIGAAGDPRAERGERLEGGLDRRPVGVGIVLDEGRLRDEPMGAPERHPPPDAQRPRVRARVDDRARIPRPAAQDERAGREGLEGSRPGELEGEVRPVEVEESHRGRSVRRWAGRGPRR